MPSKTASHSDGSIINKYALNVHWPRIWIIVLGIILLFLCLCIAGMEVGHTLFDLRRSTAFGGFILFIPLLICSIFVFITGKLESRSMMMKISMKHENECIDRSSLLESVFRHRIAEIRKNCCERVVKWLCTYHTRHFNVVKSNVCLRHN